MYLLVYNRLGNFHNVWKIHDEKKSDVENIICLINFYAEIYNINKIMSEVIKKQLQIEILK